MKFINPLREIIQKPNAAVKRLQPGGRGLRPFIALVMFLFSIHVILLPAQFHSHPPEHPEKATDGMIEYLMAWNLLTTGSIAFSQEQAEHLGPRVVRGSNGLSYAVFGPGFATLFVAGIWLDRVFYPIETPQPRFFTLLINPLIHSLTAALIMAILVQLQCNPNSALWGALLYGLTTTSFIYARLSYNMTWGVMWIVAMLWITLVIRREKATPGRMMLLGTFLGCAVIVRLPSVLFLVPILVYLTALRVIKVQDVVYSALAFMPFAACIAIYNWSRFGGPFSTGYHTGLPAFHFNTSLIESLPALAISPGRSLLVYSPTLIIGLMALHRTRHRPELALILSIISINVVFYGLVSNWHSLHAWGPRYQLLVAGLLSIPAGLTLRAIDRRTVLLGFIGTGWLFQLIISLVPYNGYRTSQLWTWTDTQLTRTMSDAFYTLASQHWPRLNLWWVQNPNLAWFSLWLMALFAACILLMSHPTETTNKRTLSHV